MSARAPLCFKSYLLAIPYGYQQKPRGVARHRNSVPRGGVTLQSEFPEIAKMWHPEMNGDVRPDDVRPKSNIKRWWLCSKSNCEHEHKWEAPPERLVKALVDRGTTGCPFCSGRRWCACNSLGVLHPDVAALWHPIKNGELTPFDLAPQSNKKVWWKCPNGPDHEWQTAPSGLVIRDRGCPCCSVPPKKVSITNCLETMRPDIVPYWHQELNGEVTPRNVFPGTSTKKYWWKCPEGADHIWEASPEAIGSALSSKFEGIGCPCCSGRQLSVTNRLDLNYSTIAHEWHPTKNGDVTPADVTSGNDFRAWWKCSEGADHVWQASVSSRTRGHGCPCCSGHQVSVTNSLSTLFPNIANQWHPTKNGDASPSEFPSKAKKRVWWKCPKGPDHEWEAPIYSRAVGRGCPFCANRKGSGKTSAVSVTNSLATRFPDVAAEWHPTKNGDCTPDKVVFGSHTKYWWKCAMDSEHEWRTSVQHRTGRGSGCPSCAKYGIDVSAPTMFYVLRIENHAGIWWWKAGISVDPERRAGQIKSSIRAAGMELDVIVHEVIEFETGKKALDFESRLLNAKEIRTSTEEVFSGCTELFISNPLEYARENDTSVSNP